MIYRILFTLAIISIGTSCQKKSQLNNTDKIHNLDHTDSTDMKEKQKDDTTENGTSIISAPIVMNPFVMKNGYVTDRKEYYIRRSIQDYFIKFCESKITKEELEKALSECDDFMKALTLEVEFRDGTWDQCDEGEMIQSRIGEYVVVLRIVA